MKNLTLENITNACNGKFVGRPEDLQKEVNGIAIDSRKIGENDLFIATRGERVDGHDFVSQVMERKALCVIVEKPVDAKNYILVEDSFQAIKQIAAFYRSNLDIKVVGITGSVGKTSTKEMISSVLATKYQVLKTQGNFNNEIGMPLTIFNIRPEHEIAVLEMGISDFGEMSRLTAIAKPDICVITNIGQCHLENLGDRKGILKAKTEIFEGLSKDGIAILNGEDDMLLSLKDTTDVHLEYFFKESDIESRKELNADGVYASDIRSKGLLGTICTIHTPMGEFCVRIPIPGEHMVLNALAATRVGLALSLSLEQIKEGIEKVEPVSGRSRIIDMEKYIVIDDCYNANPVSMKAALDLLKTADTKTTAILGSMFELGENEVELHREIGTYARESGIDQVITVGELGEYIGTSFYGKKSDLHYQTLEELLVRINGELSFEGQTVLVKASNGMHLEEVVKCLSNF